MKFKIENRTGDVSMEEKIKVLVIDDERGIRDMLSYALGKEGYIVFTAENGEIGIEKVKKEDIDVVITDIKMPGLDGVTVLGKIKEIKPNTEVIVATGYASMETAIESLRKGAYDYINKPFNINELSALVSKAYETKQLKSQLVSLKELDKLKDEFIAAVSHELKTPLMAISGAIELLLASEGVEDEENLQFKYDENTKKILEIIDRQTKKMRVLVNNILDFAKMEAGFFVLKKQKTSFIKIVNEAIKEVQSLAESKKIEITKQLPVEEDVTVNCDPDQIERVITNFLTNSIKYTQEGGKVSVSFEKTDNEVKLTVEDNGKGIDKENLEKVFERFYRVDQSLNRKESGAGLGLSICKKIIELHNGKIWAESEGLGKGSRFIFKLPIG